MDKPIRKRNSMKYVMSGVAIIVAALIYLVSANTSFSGSRIKNIELDKIIVYEAELGEFTQEVSFLGKIEPRDVFYIDAIEGGVVESISVKNGGYVNKGDSIVRLSNTSLVLEVIRSEAEITQQLNNLYNLEIELERNKLAHLNDLLEARFNIKRLTRELTNFKALAASDNLSKDELKRVTEEYEYWVEKDKLIKRSQETDLKIQEKQMTQLRKNAKRLEDSLAVTKKNLASLDIKAPVSGLLTDFSIKAGQSLAKGDRIGRIDGVDHFVVVAELDEYYVEDMGHDVDAAVYVDGIEYALTVRNIYPEIINGKFKVEFNIDENAIKKARRGRTLNGIIKLNKREKIVSIPYEGFSDETGNNWVFVLSKDEQKAMKRQIKPGKMSRDKLEVVEGLQPGEKVIVSSYRSLSDYDELHIN